MKLDKTYLRDMAEYPLPQGLSGEDTNPQPGSCNNFNYRKNDGVPIYVVQHYTVVDCDHTVKIFTRPGVSAHYVVKPDGTVCEFVSPEYRAYHAGPGGLASSSKLGSVLEYDVLKNDMNSWSIGIENVNSGNEEFTSKQIESNILLCQKLCDENPSIDPKCMLGHSDWAIGRKIDPGPFFPWEKFANAKELYPEVIRNFGIYPRIEDLDLKSNPAVQFSYNEYQENKILSEDVENLRSNLRECGYDVPEGTGEQVWAAVQQAILAFRIHFSGPAILGDATQKQAWADLCDGSKNGDPEKILSQFDENDLMRLGDILDQWG